MDLFDASFNLSPIKPEDEESIVFRPCVARKLFYDSSEDMETSANTPPSPHSPPYKRVRQLRLSEEPSTPSTSNNSYDRLMRIRQRRAEALLGDSLLSNQDSMMKTPIDKESYEKLLIQYGNPYTLEVQTLLQKRACPVAERDLAPTVRAKRIKELNITRFKEEFVILNTIKPTPGSVVCMKRLDGCIYNVKQSPVLPEGSPAERRAVNEVYAHAALKHAHIVNYYSAWLENDAMMLQTEYCDGGTLRNVIEDNGPLDETELLYLLSHIAAALDYLHSLSLSHMNISPSSIHLCDRTSNPISSDDDDDNHNNNHNGTYTYKLGNLGHVTRVTSPDVDFPTDSVYLPPELRLGDYSQLAAADIYALGMTVYEAGGGVLHNGELTPGDISLPNVSKQLNSLLQCMTNADPSLRPSPSTVRYHGRLSKPDLIRCIAMEEHKTQLLAKQLEMSTRFLKQLKTKRRKRTSPRSSIQRSLSTESASSINSLTSLSSDSSSSLSNESTMSVSSLPSRLGDEAVSPVMTRSLSASSIGRKGTKCKSRRCNSTL